MRTYPTGRGVYKGHFSASKSILTSTSASCHKFLSLFLSSGIFGSRNKPKLFATPTKSRSLMRKIYDASCLEYARTKDTKAFVACLYVIVYQASVGTRDEIVDFPYRAKLDPSAVLYVFARGKWRRRDHQVVRLHHLQRTTLKEGRKGVHSMGFCGPP